MSPLNLLNHPICFAEPKRLTPVSAWHQHIPFAMFLVDVLRPKTIVELGTAYGDSYCAFCQAVEELNLETRCYAIDTWQGDPQTGFYRPEVLADLRTHHDPLYGAFSRLVQSTFRDAINHFANGSIDLLHIDGYHVYEQVKEDFETWLPKVSRQGVILLHDANVRELDFGVWKLWEESKGRYPHFEFIHGHGLGLLAVGKSAQEKLQALLNATSEEANRIRQFFFQLGHRWDMKVETETKLTERQARIATLETTLAERDQQALRLAETNQNLQTQLSSLTQQMADREKESQRVQEQLAELQETRQTLTKHLAEERKQVEHLQDQLEELARLNAAEKERILREHEQTVSTLAEKMEELARLNAAEKERILREHEQTVSTLAEKMEELARLNAAEKERILRKHEQTVHELQMKSAVLNQIYHSHGWKALSVYYRLREKLLPEGSRRKRVARFFWTLWQRNSSRPSPRQKTSRHLTSVRQRPADKEDDLLRRDLGSRATTLQLPRYVREGIRLLRHTGWRKFIFHFPRYFTEGIGLLRDMRLVAASGLFDSDWYLQQNLHVANAGLDPLVHYLRRGTIEGLDPNPFFDSDWYLQQNSDVAKAGVNPLVHYLRWGANEGRDPSPHFHSESYLQRYPDVAKVGVNPLAHYRRSVATEGRVGNAASFLNWLDESSRAGKNITRAEGRPVLNPRPIECPVPPIHLRRGATDRRLICVSHVLPYPSRAGNEYRIHRMLAWLAGQGFEIFLVTCPLPGETITTKRLMDACSVYSNFILCQRDGTLLHRLADGDAPMKELVGVKPRAFGKLLREKDGGPVAQKVLQIVRTFCPDLLVEVLLQLDALLQPEVFWVNYVFMTRALPLIRREALKVVDTHDVFSTKRDKVSQFGIEDGLALTAEEEASLVEKADLAIAIQADEAEELRRLVPKKPIVTAGVDFDPIDSIPAPAHHPVILLVASDNTMNVRGLKDFLRFAWPPIRREWPDAELRIGGTVGMQVEVDDPAVTVMGCIDDLPAAYAAARVVINPAIAGTGIKIKTIEALCHLRPIVVWPSGVDGLGVEARTLCHIATNWYDFAHHVIELCKTGDATQALVRKRDDIHRMFSAKTVYAALGIALSELYTGRSSCRVGSSEGGSGHVEWAEKNR